MEAVIKTGGKQYLVKEGDKIQIEKTSFEVGAEIGFDEILYISDEKNIVVTTTNTIAAATEPAVVNIGLSKILNILYGKDFFLF